MALFLTSFTATNRHGVFGVERNPPATIRATGTGTACLVDQFPWGPSQVLTSPASIGDLINTVAPPGFSHTGSGYLSVIKKAWPKLKYVRVLGSDAVKALANLPNAVPTNIVRVTLKYFGVAGNSCTWTVSDATDGDANHFNLTVNITGASGATTDIVHNINVSGVGTDSLGSASELSAAFLVGTIAKLATGRPVNGSGTFATGSDGTISSATYVGTQGTGDKGIALLEGDKTIDVVFTGDPGSSFRAVVNAGLVAHADYMTDRFVCINGDAGQTIAAVKTDVANYRSTRVVYVDSWAYINDDVDGTKRLVPPASFAASVACQLSPSTSIAWKDQKVISMLNGIVDLEVDRGQNAGDNSDQGVVTLIREEDGGFAFEAGKVTANASTPAKGNLTRTRMGHYIARSVTRSLRGSVDAPNVAANQQDIVDAVERFMGTLKKNALTDPSNLPHVVNYQILDLSAFNSQSSIDGGKFIIPLNVKTSSAMEQIFLSVAFGETVQITAQ